MMTTLQNKEECGKGPKKTFAPPIQKLHSMIRHAPDSPKEVTPGVNSPQAETRPNLPKARIEQKVTRENGPSSGQETKGKAQDNKPAGKKVKEKSSLTNAEFEEIVQIVLQKSLQECLGSGLNFAEVSCAQCIVCTQLNKQRGIASSATKNTDGERVMVSHAPETSAAVEDEVVPEIRTSKPSQPIPAPSEKKLTKLPLSKRKKRARQFLVWVQCSFSNCEKWRRLPGNIDPSVLPDNWSCDQNPDLNYNRCDIPEEAWTGRESDVIYASYIPGSIIWAKQYGYPWWPGMVESDPDLGEYFLFASHLDSLPSKYHVTFFGETVSRAWIPVNMLKNFQELSQELAGVKKCRNKDYSQKLGAAIVMAQEAEKVNIQERVNLFGFWSRYSISDEKEKGDNSPEYCSEKEEEEDSAMEEEAKEKKKDPTLPCPKSAKIHTKKPKLTGGTGMANGQDRALKKKIKKRCLGTESTAAAPAPLMKREEGQRNSDLDQPDPKKKFKAPPNKTSASSLSEEKEGRMVPKCPTPPARPSVRKVAPRPQELPTEGAVSVLSEDETSSDLDLAQLMEDIGGESEEKGELQQRDDADEFSMAFLEE
ncbi:zinc finger CW-type PWWP domain protein 1 [Castor canadensis]|uniref:Zinc finger CW-type PWWP domain protein 1 n=3 Tax=Castor canadensis TaxID=51338 RepID=A0AC58MQM2_CASCN